MVMRLITSAVTARQSRKSPAPAPANPWLLEALRDSRKQAQLLADIAYEAWSTAPSAARYAAYRRAQDGADALTNDLAELVRALRSVEESR
jgi:hypothetical protein